MTTIDDTCWVLYYDSQHGHAYYHNASTGESVWAQEDRAATIFPVTGEEEENVSWKAVANVRDEESCATSDNHLEEMKGDESEDSLEESDADDDDDADHYFAAMLATPEGQAALQAEMERAGRAIDKRSRARQEATTIRRFFAAFCCVFDLMWWELGRLRRFLGKEKKNDPVS